MEERTRSAGPTGGSAATDEALADRAVALAGSLLARSRALERTETRGARRRRRRFAAMVSDDEAKEFTLALSDEVARTPDPVRAAKRFARLVATGVPRRFGVFDRVLLRAGALAAPRAPRLVMPMVVDRLRRETEGVILSADDPAFARHLARRAVENVRCNVNVLGESIVGEGEALRRLTAIAERLARPDVHYVSVKISAITSHVSALAFDATVHAVSERLRLLYREARRHHPPKFVNLDMEEYRDLDLTIEVFRSVLDEPEFVDLSAGIVLQAYLPDAHAAAKVLCEWARARVDVGRAPIKIRLVKGANLAMETVEAELRGWELAPYTSKADVDASYKAVLDILLDERYDRAVLVGLASHNLFDVAWGLVLRERLAGRGAHDRLEIEMLEGMAPEQSAAVHEASGGMLLYTPVVPRDDYPAAIAYLVRRLDENTAPQNFLRQLFDIEPGNDVFAKEAARFREAVRARKTVSDARRRMQDRSANVPQPTIAIRAFANEPDTDFALPANRAWIAAALAAWRPPTRPVGPIVDGVEIGAPHAVDVAFTCSPWESYAVGLADADTVERAVDVAARAAPAWAARPVAERASLVHAVGDVIARHRGEILATMAHDAGKTVGEGDPEVSEAVDFACYYASCARALPPEAAPLGTIVVAPPWNFPYAIPMGGVLAALAAGNTVILKPAPQTILTASLVARHCWEAGVPRDVLQFLPCPDDDVGRALITHDDVDAVILTGAHATAQLFLDWKPTLRLHAETSGKNAMVITTAADIDAAVKDLVRSAFGHAGQKCSAASLAIVEAPLYDSAAFRERLRDAVASLRTGAAHDLRTDVGPLIDPPSGNLRRALTELDPGESWLVEPRELEPRLWTPGVRIGVAAGSWFHRTECFGQVLGVMRADDLDHALALQNATDYGLTAGLHSLDAIEIDRWVERVQAGNLYVNRGITGAIVQRQPFGGWKHSVVGATVKAGGPRYVASLCRFTGASPREIDTAAATFRTWCATELRGEHDPSGLRAETNVMRLRPLVRIVVRVGASAPAGQLDLARHAAAAAGASIVVSTLADETDGVFASRLGAIRPDRLRVIGDVDDVVRRAAHRASVPVDDAPVSARPDHELPRWLREQSVSITRHRHGHLPNGVTR